MTSANSRRGETTGLWSIRRHIVAVVLIGLGVFAVATVLLWLALGLPAAPGPDTKLNVVKIALSVVAGVGGVVALVVAYRKQRIGEAAEAREHVKVLNERFAGACAQIGHEKPTVRLAGMYAMASLADEWAEQRQVCIDVLCAYLRIPYEPALDSPWHHDEESEVRFSITSVISDHLRPGAPVSWQGHEFNLLRVILRSADFADIQVTGGRLLFSLARFPGGWTSFDGMHVSGGEVWFGGAEFLGGRVSFDNAEFSAGRVQFDGATFTGGEVTFRGARFTGGEVDLSKVSLDDYTTPPVFDPWETPPPGLLLPGA
ncbi:pentapeptide repeat-containing protein [Amycolatopsis sp. A133]|uniref:pentapeptide repeat-containing protein n=1 Tax=Amycolatopsis sp. A133 TaxID=3064472 RepID=UPI0027FC59B3|nr:pentapeptide repeat-containing protein [Amycolatopsis sp. A133]MDQ7802646.1 pentapeptide repeat-containing protein [Amycolatopsis sp. A133]